jgi:hypothetical protein
MNAKKLWFVILCLLAVAATAVAQEEFHEDAHDPLADPVVAPMIVPTIDDFAPAPSGTNVAGEPVAPATVGLNSYIEVGSNMKAGLLTPFYRFSPQFALKARVPLIFERKMNFFGSEATASGLGDVSLDAEYTKALSSPGTLFRLQLTAKLPTGDDEKMAEDEFGNEYNIPLGTGTLDYIARAQYAKSAPASGWLASLVYRKNSGNESTFDNGSNVVTTTVTAADQVSAAFFGRKLVSGKWWLHLGAAATMIGDGTSKTENSDGTPGSEFDILSKGTLLDLYPGVSYALGAFQPFLGVRLPVVTSYDNEFANDERDLAVIFQFSYSPTKLY